MSVTASDIVIYAATNYSEDPDDAGTTGGAINTAVRVVFDDIVATDVVEVFSSNTGDSGNLTVYGRDATGVEVNEVLALQGTGLVEGAQSFERILKFFYDASQAGTISLRDNSTSGIIATIEPGVSGLRRPFINATANATGGAEKDLFEKVFVRNNNATNALLNVTLSEVASGVFARVQYSFESGSGGSQTVANRTISPTGITAFSDNPSLPNTNIGPLVHNAIWLKLNLPAGQAATNSFAQFTINGSTT